MNLRTKKKSMIIKIKLAFKVLKYPLNMINGLPETELRKLMAIVSKRIEISDITNKK